MTTPPSALPPANWYPDPQKPGQLRYWDGQRWTQHVHPLEQQPAQGASGYASPSAQTAANPLAQAVQQSEVGVYQPVVQASPLTTARPQSGSIPAAGPSTGGTFLPAGAQGGQGGQGTQGGYPGTGATPTFQPTGTQGAQGVQGAQGGYPGTGATPMFQPGGGAASGSPGVLNTPKYRDLDEDTDEAEPPSSTAAFAAVIGFAALAVIALGVYGLGTPVDDYLPYAGAGLGFVAVFMGFLGKRQAAAGLMGGALYAWSGIFLGFLAMLVSAYEIMSPGDLYERFFG